MAKTPHPTTQAYLQFLTDPDQSARRAELASFFGPNADKFLPVYDKLQKDAASGAGLKFRLFGGGFSVPAFFFGPVWFFYRKMWVFAGVITVAMLAIGWIPGAGRAGLPIGAMLGLMAYRSYVQQAITTVQKLRRPDGTIDPVELQRAGGVSRTAAWIAGVIYGLLCAFAVLGMILLIQSGEPLPR